MMLQKVIILLVIVFLAVVTASILKFAMKKQLNLSNVIFSLLSPFFLVRLMINFFIYSCRKDMPHVSFLKKILLALRLLLAIIQSTPLIHTLLINQVFVKDSTTTLFELKQNVPTKTVAEDLHGIIFSANKWRNGRGTI